MRIMFGSVHDGQPFSDGTSGYMGVYHTGLSFLSGRTLEEVPARALTGTCDSGREVVSPVG